MRQTWGPLACYASYRDIADLRACEDGWKQLELANVALDAQAAGGGRVEAEAHHHRLGARARANREREGLPRLYV